MAGSTWNDRQPTDWLASNGRWYSSSTYPRGWEGTALPPAPGHGGATSVLSKYAKMATAAVGLDDEPDYVTFGSASDSPPPVQSSDQHSNRPPPRSKTPPAPPSRSASPSASSASSASGFSVVKSGRQVADATVTNQRDYAEKLPSGTPAPPSLGAGSSTSDEAAVPASPGRLSRETPQPPTASTEPTHAVEPRQAPTPATKPSDSLEVLAGDLGAVLGGARRKIQKALNDAYEG